MTPPSGAQPRKKLAWYQWLLGVGAFLAAFIIPFFVSGPHGFASGQSGPDKEPGVLMLVLAGATFFLIFLSAGAVVLVLATITRGFTSDLSRPVYPGFRRRLFYINTTFRFCVVGAMFGLSMATITPVLEMLHLPRSVAQLPPALVLSCVAFIATAWFSVWKPLWCDLTKARLHAMGVPVDHLSTGRCVGISNPDVSSFSKFGLIEDDIGMLWLTSDRIIYRGDGEAWDIRPGDLRRIDLVVDAGGVDAYFGLCHIVLRVSTGAGDRSIRLHLEDCWTASGTAAATNVLAGDLERWSGRA